MKILFIGDMHLTINKFQLNLSFLNWVNETIKTYKPDLVVNLGDTFHNHANIRSEIMSEFIKHVRVGLETCPYVYLLGNHDMYKPNDSKYHALLHIKDTIPGFHIYDEITDGPWGMTWVPYQHDPDKFPKQTQSICVAHQTFKGADYGDITVKDGVDSESISADVIISGHIHKRQVLGKVIYPGSPFSQSVNDINQVKGLMLYETETYQRVFINTPLPIWRGARFEIGPSCNIAQIADELKTSLKDTKDHWVIEITGPKAEITSFISDQETRELFQGKDIKVKTVFTDKDKKLTKIKALSIESIVAEYISNIYSGSIDKSELATKSLELLEKINQDKRNK